MPGRQIISPKANAVFALLFFECMTLTGCSGGSAPSFDLFGAFFPAWLLCGIIGIAGAVVARVVFVTTGLANTLPYQLAVCSAIGVITAVLIWFIGLGR
ncbi:MAG: YtcA family lipoprotein [Xanthobacteraceae bacterium]